MSSDTGLLIDGDSSFEHTAVRWTVVSASCVSLVGSIFIFVTFIAFPKLRTRTSRLIVYLSVANFFSSSSYLFALPHSLCMYSAGLMQLFDVAGFFWTIAVAHNLHTLIVRKRIVVGEWVYHLLCWGIPLLLLGVTIFEDCLGGAGLWCWIKGHPARCQLLRWAVYYIPLIAAFMYCCVLYVLISVQVHSEFKEKMRKAESSEVEQDLLQKEMSVNSRLVMYLLAFVVTRVWGLGNRVDNLITPDHTLFALEYLHALFSPLQGGINAVIYGLNPNSLRVFKDLFTRVSQCRGSPPQQLSQSLRADCRDDVN